MYCCNSKCFGNQPSYLLIGEKAVTVQQQSAFRKTRRGIFLCYTHTPGGNHAGDHYDAIINVSDLPVHPVINNQGTNVDKRPDMANEDLPPTTPFVAPSYTEPTARHQFTTDAKYNSQENTNGDSEDDNVAFAPPPLPGENRKKSYSKKGKLDPRRFENIQPQCVDMLPWDIDGNVFI